MLVYQCDICRKEIRNRNNAVAISRGMFASHALCERCGAPVARFLNRNNRGEKPKMPEEIFSAERRKRREG